MGEFILKYWLQVLFTLLVSLMTAFYRLVRKEAKEDKIERVALKLGMQAILRDRLIQAYNHYIEKGCLPLHDRDNIQNMYTQYHTLGANGVIDDLMEELFNLPYSNCKPKE